VILIPLILFSSVTGVYLVSFNTFDIQMMVAITVITLLTMVLPNLPLIRSVLERRGKAKADDGPGVAVMEGEE